MKPTARAVGHRPWSSQAPAGRQQTSGMSVSSVAPPGLVRLLAKPTAHAVGYLRTLLRSSRAVATPPGCYFALPWGFLPPAPVESSRRLLLARSRFFDNSLEKYEYVLRHSTPRDQCPIRRNSLPCPNRDQDNKRPKVNVAMVFISVVYSRWSCCKQRRWITLEATCLLLIPPWLRRRFGTDW